MTEHMQQMQMMMAPMGLLLLIAFALVMFAVVYLLRQSSHKSLLATDLLSDRQKLKIEAGHSGTSSRSVVDDVVLHDTLFILPDISNYTRFMAGSHFSFSHAQQIIFSLINAMIGAAAPNIHLSKLEGDAALFYVDADKHSAEVIGETILDIFAAFFQERRRLIESNLCLCKACKHISDLDLKIFVHRGQASRFEFRGSVDHFGTDVIILHRMMKNSVTSRRYIMVTEESQQNVALPDVLHAEYVDEEADDIGTVRATVYEICDEFMDELEQRSTKPVAAPAKETAKKIWSSLQLVANALRFRR